MEVNNINSNKLNGSMGTISLFCLLQIFFNPQSHPTGFKCCHQCSHTLTSDKSIQVSNKQSSNQN